MFFKKKDNSTEAEDKEKVETENGETETTKDNDKAVETKAEEVKADEVETTEETAPQSETNEVEEVAETDTETKDTETATESETTTTNANAEVVEKLDALLEKFSQLLDFLTAKKEEKGADEFEEQKARYSQVGAGKMYGGEAVQNKKEFTTEEVKRLLNI